MCPILNYRQKENYDIIKNFFNISLTGEKILKQQQQPLSSRLPDQL